MVPLGIGMATLLGVILGQWIAWMQLERKVSALAVGCHELCSIGGINAIIEGDSFSAI